MWAHFFAIINVFLICTFQFHDGMICNVVSLQSKCCFLKDKHPLLILTIPVSCCIHDVEQP